MNTLFSLKNKTAVITGGGSGIGQAIAQLFASQGATIFVLDLNKEAANVCVEKIKETGGKAEAYACNVTSQLETKKTIEQILAQVGVISILVNSAGISHIGTLETTTENDFDRVYNVNVKGVFNMMQAVVASMKEKGGVILNMASIASSTGISDRFAYSMSKGAVLAMTFSVARDYLKHNIRCNCISPARIHTPFVDGFLKANYPGREQEMFEKLSKTQPIGRMGKPNEVASLALYLCSDEASFVTGCDYPLDGGFIKLNT